MRRGGRRRKVKNRLGAAMAATSVAATSVAATGTTASRGAFRAWRARHLMLRLSLRAVCRAVRWWHGTYAQRA